MALATLVPLSEQKVQLMRIPSSSKTKSSSGKPQMPQDIFVRSEQMAVKSFLIGRLRAKRYPSITFHTPIFKALYIISYQSKAPQQKNPAPQHHSVAGRDYDGGYLLSHILNAIPSALTSLTSLFGMGRGGTSSLLPPKIYIKYSGSFSIIRSP